MSGDLHPRTREALDWAEEHLEWQDVERARMEIARVDARVEELERERDQLKAAMKRIERVGFDDRARRVEELEAALRALWDVDNWRDDFGTAERAAAAAALPRQGDTP